MTDDNAPELRALGMEPDDLDGHTIEELTDYLEAGRQPAQPSIDQSAGCQLALDALERLRGLSPALMAADTANEDEVDAGWVQQILGQIALDARAGRRIPLASPEPYADLGITEGAVRGLIRGAEENVPGVLIGRCRIEGELTTIGAPIRVQVDVSVPYGQPIRTLTQELRAEIDRRLTTHAELHVTEVDITVHDIQSLGSDGEGTR